LQDFLQKNAANFKRPDGTVPALADVRAGVLAAWEDAQRRATAETAYEKLRTHYTVQIQKPPAVTNPAPASAPATGTS
jgi:hypothetical protein